MVIKQERSMAELAETISANTKALTNYITKHNLRQPSFSADDAVPDYLPGDDREIQKIRADLADASRELYELSIGTNALFTDKATQGHHETAVLRTIYMFKMPQHVPLSGSISYQELSQKTRLQEDKLRRILAYAFTMRVFCEPEPARVAHSAISKLLVTEQEYMDFLGHNVDDVFPGTTHQTDALQKWFTLDSDASIAEGSDDDVVAGARSGCALAFGSKTDIFSLWGQKYPERIGRLQGAMKYVNSSSLAPANETQNLFDWESLGRAVVCDVGGSGGHKSKVVALKAPQLKLITQDLPEVVAEAEKNAQKDEDAKKLMDEGRLEFEPYSFFTPQPRKDAKAYFFGRVFHDWEDADCIKILQNLVPSMQPGSSLVINDFVLAEPGTASYTVERATRMIDMQMMVGVNARERSLEQWKTLIKEGSDGKLEYVNHSTEYSVVVFQRRSD